MSMHPNRPEPQAQIGSIATQLVSPMEPRNGLNDIHDTPRTFFSSRASSGSLKRQQNHFNPDNFRDRRHSGMQRRGEYPAKASNNNMAGIRRPPVANKPIIGHSRKLSDARENGSDGDDDNVNDDDDDDDYNKTESLEDRLERVLNIVEDTGFDSIDSMASTYYTSEFSEGSIIHPMQSVSRKRRLRVLLSALHTSYKSWSGRERSAYTEEIVRAAEAICSDELQALYGSKDQRCRRVSNGNKSSPTDSSGSTQSNRNEIANRFRELLCTPDVADFMQKDIVVLKDFVCPTNDGIYML